MAHQSEDASRLPIRVTSAKGWEYLPAPDSSAAEVWLFVPPFGRSVADPSASLEWHEWLRGFTGKMNESSILAVLTTSADAAMTLPELGRSLHFQLWVAVKLAAPIKHSSAALPEHHAALLVLSKYRSSLKHTKTRIGYTYCPACERTTKDYGGKKHTYHEFGTLVSDVWRDISWAPNEMPDEVMTRLADLFGMPPYIRLEVAYLVDDESLAPKSSPECVDEQEECMTDGVQLQESRLIQGDSLEELRRIPSESIDFCFADPPYNLAKRYDSWDDELGIVEYFSWCDRWLDELARVLRPGRTCAVLNIPQWAVRHFFHLRTRLTFQNWIAWEGLSLPVRMIMPSHYSIICFSKGKARPLPGLTEANRTQLESESLTALGEFFCLRQSCTERRRLEGIRDHSPVTDLWWDIHRLKHNSRRVDHPCQLPPALMCRLIALFTQRNEMVLDPFNGAGTTSLCAELLGRRFIGIELSPQYHQLAYERHQLLRLGGDPFAKERRIPKAKNSRVKRIGSVSYEVPKKVLQLEIRALAKKLGRLPTREDVKKLSKYPLEYFDNYFISWGEVCAAARTTGMSEFRLKSEPARRETSQKAFGFMERGS